MFMVKLGIKKDKAACLAVRTLIGSGALLESLEVTPEVLIKRIASKKGTTEAALRVLKMKKFSEILIEAAKVAAKRAKKLSKGA